MRLTLKLAAATLAALTLVTGCAATPSVTTDMITVQHSKATSAPPTRTTPALTRPHPNFVLAAYTVPRTYTIPRGGTLSSASSTVYGHARYWGALYLRNKTKIGSDPDSVKAGTVLRVPRRPWEKWWHYTPPPPPKVTVSHARLVSAPSAPAAPSGSGIYSYGALESLWVSAGGPASAEAAAATVAECESGGNPDAYNPSGATGLFQILGAVVPGNLFNPMVNALNAVSKFRASGDTFAQWVCQA